MLRIYRLIVLTLAAALIGGSLAGAAELAGVTFDDTATAGEQKLVLNGLGLRTKMFVKVYVGALYLPAKTTDANSVITADVPKSVTMHFLHEVSQEKLTGAWRDGFANNSADKMGALKDRLDRFCSLWATMHEGERAVVTYLPGSGTKVSINGKEAGAVEGADFAAALMAVWFGNVPADKDLKAGMLGQ
ncbi:MAG: chalcone isomerase family protein [Candidatus Schekmanbacteria bacterium]|nr:chalcone isomerase family protein [Candidatus Schekmanbacteria bacterium]